MYVKQNFCLLFYRKMKKKNASGMVPIYVRLTIDGLEDEISSSIFINPDHWDQENRCVTKDDPNAGNHNKKLSMISVDLQRHFDLAQVQEEIATPKMVFEAYRSPLRGERIRNEQVKNLELSDAVDLLVADYCKFNNRYEKAYEDGKVPHPTRAELLANEKDQLLERIKDVAAKGNAIFDHKKWEKTLILAMNEQLLWFLQMASVDKRSAATLEKMWGRKRRVIAFMEARYKTIDMPLSELAPKFLEHFKTYNLVTHKVIENTATRYNQAIKETINRTVMNGWIVASMLKVYKCHYDETKHDWLTIEEVIKLIETDFANPKIGLARDLYVFSSFTGLSYAEVRSLGPDDIMTGIDGKKWVSKNRKKTDGDETLPLLPIALELMDKYKDHPVSLKRHKIFPVPCNVEFNRRLKVVASLTGIRIVLRTHKARFFFANEVTYNQGVQLKTIGRMLGHKSDRAVHTYVQANRTAISHSMEEVKSKLFGADGELKGLTVNPVKADAAKVVTMGKR